MSSNMRFECLTSGKLNAFNDSFALIYIFVSTFTSEANYNHLHRLLWEAFRCQQINDINVTHD